MEGAWLCPMGSIVAISKSSTAVEKNSLIDT
jgi:hypothetical protein